MQFCQKTGAIQVGGGGEPCGRAIGAFVATVEHPISKKSSLVTRPNNPPNLIRCMRRVINSSD